MRIVPALLLLASACAPALAAPPSDDEKGPYLGILFSPIPEALLDHLPILPREGGVLVTHVLPMSPADGEKGLRKHDILLQFNADKIRNAGHLAHLIQNSKVDQAVRLNLIRGGQEKTVEIKIGLGTILRIAKEEGPTPPGMAKTVAPAAVSVTGVPMEGNRLKVTIEYTDAGRIRSVTYAGDAAEIDREIDKLPQKVQKLARAAVQRLRELNLQKNESPPTRNRE